MKKIERMISLDDLRKVKGIGPKTIERIKKQILQSEEDKNYISEYNPNIKLDVNKIYQGDCLELMNGIPDKSVDMILCDLPYGTTACKWDTIIPFEPLWEQYERVIKDNGAIVLTASQPFTSALVMSNVNSFCYSWVWDKKFAANFVQAKRQPLKDHEDVLVFSKAGKMPKYNPQMTKREKPIYKGGNKQSKAIPIARTKVSDEFGRERKRYDEKYPTTQITFNVREGRGLHPTQKPVALFEYLIKTYTNEGETVLDNCMGSGTTGVACVNANRKFIGIELDDKYFEIAKQRISEELNKPEQITMDDFYIKDGRCDDIEVIGNIYEDEEEIKRGASK